MFSDTLTSGSNRVDHLNTSRGNSSTFYDPSESYLAPSVATNGNDINALINSLSDDEVRERFKSAMVSINTFY